MNKALRPLLAASTAAVALGLSFPADAAVDMFLKIEGIPGEATHKGHENEIEVFSWSWGMSQGANAIGSSRMPTRACATELVMTKHMDKASPKLMGAVMNGTRIPKAKFTVQNSGEVPHEMVTIELDGILIGMLQESGSSERPMESVSLRFTSATVTYTPIDPKTGKPGAAIPVKFSAGAC